MSVMNIFQVSEETHPAFVPSLPVASAVLCVDCELITVSFHDACPICGSKSLLNVAQILGGTLSRDRVRAIDSQLEIVRCA
jgi:hypothetical protein